MSEMMKEALDEATRVLREICNTPLAVRVHFEFDVEVGKTPEIVYEVERYASVGTQKTRWKNED